MFTYGKKENSVVLLLLLNRKNLLTNPQTYVIINVSNKREVKKIIKIENKISGWKITGYETKPIFNNQIVSLEECMKTIKQQKTMDFILDTFRFSKAMQEGTWIAILDWDTIMKISIMETNPEEEKLLENHFGKDWIKNYLRFNH